MPRPPRSTDPALIAVGSAISQAPTLSLATSIMTLSAVPGKRQQELAAALLQQYVLTCPHHGRGVTATTGRGATVTAGQGATATAGRGATATASRGYRTRVRTTADTVASAKCKHNQTTSAPPFGVRRDGEPNVRQRRTIRGAGGRAYETERCPSQLWGSWRPSELRRADDSPVTAAFRGNTATNSARAVNCSEAHWRTLAHTMTMGSRLVKAGATESMTTQRATHNPQQLSIDAPAPAVLTPSQEECYRQVGGHVPTSGPP